MFVPHARASLLRGAERRPLLLRPGEILGRGDVHHVLPWPEVSEAHALVSLRPGGLVLLRLRGTLLVEGEVVEEAPLEPGARIELAEQLVLVVDEVLAPPRALALSDGVAVLPLPYRYACHALSPLHESPTGELETWLSGVRFEARVRGVPVPLLPGAAFDGVHVVEVPPTPVTPTLRSRGELSCEVLPVTLHDPQPHLFPELQGLLLQGLAAEDPPVHWSTLARRWMWRGEDPEGRRKHFENVLTRLQKQLDQIGHDGLVLRLGPGHYTLNRAAYRVR